MRFKLSRQAEKAISKLDASTAGRIFKAFVGLPSKGDIKALDGKHKGQFRLRVGDWRIIYEIHDETVSVAHILPRGDAY